VKTDSDQDLIVQIESLIEQVEELKSQKAEYAQKLSSYLPILEKWNQTKDEQANDIEALISSAKCSRRVEFTLWFLNQPVIVLVVVMSLCVVIEYLTITPGETFNLNTSITWFVPVLLAGIAAFISATNRAFENSQKKGDAMILADIKREITPWLEKLEDKYKADLLELKQQSDKQRVEQEARAEKQRVEQEARAEKQRVEFENRVQNQRDEDNARIAKIFDAIDAKFRAN
jgi:hypothetical protein